MPALNPPQPTISPQLSQMQIAITAKRLFLPITETQSELWLAHVKAESDEKEEPR